MDFCNLCENMLYIKIDIDDENKLKNYCKNCNFEKELPKTTTPKNNTNVEVVTVTEKNRSLV